MSVFVSDKKCNELADELLVWFESGDLHSRSRTGVIAKVALELLADEGLPKRWSLACVIAKKAHAAWLEIIHKTKGELA